MWLLVENEQPQPYPQGVKFIDLQSSEPRKPRETSERPQNC